MPIVARTFGMDFIYFDLLFAIIWITILLFKGHESALKFGIFGFLFIYLLDGIIWYHFLGVRTVQTPFSPDLFMIYFSFTYGIIEFSYVVIMFQIDDNSKRFYWTFLLYLGWILSALVSQIVPLDDRTIMVSRDMELFRTWQVIITIFGYSILYTLKYFWKRSEHLNLKRMLYLVMVGFLVHFGMEITLFLSRIRPSENLSVLVFNSLIEFNMGIPILYGIWLNSALDLGRTNL